jgi:DNA-binding LacI/PurR family transcriptional regulator
VYSGKGPVAPATRERVLEQAEKLGYVGPNPAASSLRTGRSGVVAVITWDGLSAAFRDPYAVSLLDGLVTALDEASTGILLLPQSRRQPGHAIARLSVTAVDAAVLLGCGPESSPVVDHLQARRVPVVSIGTVGSSAVTRVDVDNRSAMRQAAEYLHQLGHRRVGVLSLPPGGVPPEGCVPLAELLAGATDVETRERLFGISDVFGASIPAVAPATWDIEGGKVAAGQLLDAAPLRPTAIIAQADLLAMGAIAVAEGRGLVVPDELSVTGFDGIPTPWWPGVLTTVVQPGVAKGEVAGRMVLDLISGRSVTDVVMPTELRIGTSTGPPR